MSMYLAMERELLVVRHEHEQWQTASHLVGMQPTCIALDPLRPERVYCGTFGRGLWRSVNAGRTFEPIGDAGAAMRPWQGDGIAHPQITSVAVSLTERARDTGVVYVGTEPTTLFRSEDGGETWWELKALRELPSAPTWRFPPRPYTSHVRWITPDLSVAGRLFLAIEAGALVRSLDGGAHWEDRIADAPFDTHTLLMHPQMPHRLYSAAGDGIAVQGRGYNESFDAGQTWQRPDEGLQHHYLWSVAVDPANPETMVVSAARSPAEAHDAPQAQGRNANSVLYRRTDGKPWLRVTAGLPEAQGTVIPVLATNQEEPGVFYALSNKGCYRSADAGESWEPLPVSWKPVYERQHQQAIVVSSQ